MSDFASKLKKLRKKRGLRQIDLAQELGLSQTTIANYEQNNRFPKQEILNQIAGYFNVSLDYLLGRTKMKEISSDIDSTIDIENKEDTFIKLRKNYFNLLLKGKKREASQLILGVIKQGITIKEIYLHVFEPALYEVGKLWERNKISVAHEHYFTHATLSIIDQLYPYIENNQKKDYSIVAVTSIGESHYLGLRMVADFFEMEGWNSYYLGINTPTDSIIKYIEEKKADILIISATLPFNVNGVTNLIKAVSSAKEIKTIVGGQAFMYDKNSWKKTGADAYATNAQSAVEIAKDLVNDKT